MTQTAMKRNLKYAAACLALLIGGSVLASSTFSVGAPKAATATALTDEKPPAQVSEINGYRAWTRVNPQPVSISARVSIACAVMIPPLAADDSRSPHTGKMITVYVNETGRRAMMTELTPKFPVGSVIVKEKLSPDKGDEPELLTVMVKRERGFNPKVGDWEFMAVNGAGTKIDARGRLENCQACHVSMKDTDFISRMYLPDELRNKLR